MTKKVKKLTITDLLKQKEKYQVKSDTTEELFIERFQSSITIKKPERSLIMESISMTEDKDQAEKADDFLVYNIVVEPNLKDAELQKEFGCAEPTDIVGKLFDAGEVTNIAKFAMDMLGYGASVKQVSDLKN